MQWIQSKNGSVSGLLYSRPFAVWENGCRVICHHHKQLIHQNYSPMHKICCKRFLMQFFSDKLFLFWNMRYWNCSDHIMLLLLPSIKPKKGRNQVLTSNFCFWRNKSTKLSVSDHTTAAFAKKKANLHFRTFFVVFFSLF